MPPLLTTGQAADLLGYTVEHVRRLYREGRIPGHRIGGTGHIRFDEHELRDALLQPSATATRRPDFDALERSFEA